MDIGYHYVGVGSDGLPLDADHDGAYDYYEDQNGNGVWNSGETYMTDVDSDYDGRSDGQEWAEGTDPCDSASVVPARLGYWKFNDASYPWNGEDGEQPLESSSIQNMPSFDGNALQLTNSGALLKYRDVETDGVANINLRSGSVRLTFKHYWYTFPYGSGPGHWVRLAELGDWKLSLDPAGTNLTFQTLDSGGNPVTNVQARMNFSPSGWQEITLAYSPSSTVLSVKPGGTLYWTGTGVANYPNKAQRANGFTVGSANDGTYEADGLIDELETFNYPLNASERESVHEVLTATAATLVPRLTLNWRTTPMMSYAIWRKQPQETSWTLLATNHTAWSYADTNANLAVGQRYEYQLAGGAVPRYILAGIQAAPVHQRGKAILVVDNTRTNALAADLALLTTNLVGDGWTVVRTNVPRHDDVTWSNNTNAIASIKSFIVSTYNADTNTKAVFLIGHVPIPYSGMHNPDGHGGRCFPADAFYGEVDGTWTDSTNYQTTGEFTSGPRWQNVAGDGKFDQSYLPSTLELAVGRVDFAKLICFTNKTEDALLQQYLSKDHNWRHKLFTLQERVTEVDERDERDNVVLTAVGHASRFFGLGPRRVVHGDFLDQTVGLYSNPTDRYNNSSLWGFFAQESQPYSIGWHSCTSFVDPAKEPLTSFAWVYGSYVGDWDYTNAGLRTFLGTPNYTLSAVWGVQVSWGFEKMASGEILGSGLVRMANEISPSSTRTYAAILGDPTLRLHTTAPVAGLTGSTNGSTVTLSWSRSPDPYAGYYVYRSTTGIGGAFTNLTTAPLGGNSFTDLSPPSGAKTYQVRVAALVTSGSGSYTNLSQGIFVDVP